MAWVATEDGSGRGQRPQGADPRRFYRYACLRHYLAAVDLTRRSRSGLAVVFGDSAAPLIGSLHAATTFSTPRCPACPGSAVDPRIRQRGGIRASARRPPPPPCTWSGPGTFDRRSLRLHEIHCPRTDCTLLVSATGRSGRRAPRLHEGGAVHPRHPRRHGAACSPSSFEKHAPTARTGERALQQSHWCVRIADSGRTAGRKERCSFCRNSSTCTSNCAASER